jgi:hypothetical protein
MDFTGFPHFRHPLDAGGAYWTGNMALNQVFCLVTIWFYSEYYHGPAKLERQYLFPVFGSLALVWVLSFVTFLSSLNPGYWKGFLSLETGAGYCVRYFRANAGDEEKQIAVFAMNMKKWTPIADEVRAWTKLCFKRWKDERPSWFTKGLIAGIPDDYIPTEEVSVLHEAARGKRRLTLDRMDVAQRIQVVVDASLIEQRLELAEAGPIRPSMTLASSRQDSFKTR